MYTTSTLSVSGLMNELMQFVSEGMEGPFVLTIFDTVYNPNDAFGIKNVLELFPNVEIHVAYMAGNTSGALCIGAAVPRERRYITANGVFAFTKPVYQGHGDFKSLQIATEAQKEIEQRIDKILDEAYDLPESSFEMHKEERTPRADEVASFGLRDVEELLK